MGRLAKGPSATNSPAPYSPRHGFSRKGNERNTPDGARRRPGVDRARPNLYTAKSFAGGHQVTVFDLIFLAAFFTAVATLIVAGVAALRGRRARAVSLVKRLGIGVALYFAVVVLVAVGTP